VNENTQNFLHNESQ